MAVTIHSNTLHLQFAPEFSKKLSQPKKLSFSLKLPGVTRTSNGLPEKQWGNGAPGMYSSRQVSCSPGWPAMCRRYCGIVNSVTDETRSRFEHTRSLPHSRPVENFPRGDPVEWARSTLQSSLCQIAPALVGIGSALVISLCGASFAWAEDEPLTIMFPASGDDRISSVQRTLVEAWGAVGETYWDTTFNNQNWEEKLSESLTHTFTSESSEAAYGEIKALLASLGDPFTRIVTPQEYKNFRINNDGALEGVGLLIASEPDTGRLIILSPIKGGPAARAGIHEGDELIGIDGVKVNGMNGEQAATRLRGPAGSEVLLTVRHRAEDSARQEASSLVSDFTQVRIQRETITLSPVHSTLLPHEDEAGHEFSAGYIRLTTFSQNAAKDMEEAVTSLKEEGASSFILDLRNNPGGLVRAGLDIAEMWLDGDAIVVNTVDRSGEIQAIGMRGNRAITDKPLAVLVNGGSASASEILAGALHDNGRARLIGDSEHTYGKGKIQSVFEMGDGSALFVTIAKYLSPALHQIDQVGIIPDMTCSIRSVESKPPPLELPMPGGGGALVPRKALIMEPDSVTQLQADACILTAEYELDRHMSGG